MICVLCEKSSYFSKKGVGKKPPSKRLREDVEEQVLRAITEIKDLIREEFAEVKNSIRIEFEGKIREAQTKTRVQIQDEIKAQI